MSLAEKYLEYTHEEMLNDDDYRSGYEYARKNIKLWQEESAELLQFVARSCVEEYRLHQYRQVLGMAAYLRELAEAKLLQEINTKQKPR